MSGKDLFFGDWFHKMGGEYDVCAAEHAKMRPVDQRKYVKVVQLHDLGEDIKYFEDNAEPEPEPEPDFEPQPEPDFEPEPEPEPAALAAAELPLRAFLASEGLDDLHDPLHELGAELLSDLADVTDAEFTECGIPLEKGKWLRGCGSGAGGGAAGIPEAVPKEDDGV